jgi:hypothetical protein
LFERDLKAIGEEGHKDVRLDAMFELMIDRSYRKVVFQFFEGLLDLGELLSEGPEGCQSSPSLLVRRR